MRNIASIAVSCCSVLGWALSLLQNYFAVAFGAWRFLTKRVDNAKLKCVYRMPLDVLLSYEEVI